MKVLMIFIDGLGIGCQDETNPYLSAATPYTDKLLGGHVLFAGVDKIINKFAVMIPTDACLGVAGLPQSATGQTTLWTGVNAALAVGRHINQYPDLKLKDIIIKHSIMKILGEAGKKVTFANAYRSEFFKMVRERKLGLSTSTLVALSSGTRLRTIDDLKRGNAVYQDFTNKMLIDWGYDVEVLSARQAGINLARIAEDHDFTLYEYFITDRIGHKQDLAAAVDTYEKLDLFIQTAVENSNLDEMVIMIVSDHGNIEDISTATHTLNKVATFIISYQVEKLPWPAISSLTDITPFVRRTILDKI
ncbi:MAG: alkaline phosphatase family protein [Syntrophomonadaceae bacterium]|jgi:2,3-bisphosphoglycerate-independent phosphoglycerate mutase